GKRALRAAPNPVHCTNPPRAVTGGISLCDRTAFTDEDGWRFYASPADGGTPRQITNGDWNHSAPAFSGDGRWILFSAYREADGDNAFRRSHIYAANAETGDIRQLTRGNGGNAGPQVSPDGRFIAYMHSDSVDHS